MMKIKISKPPGTVFNWWWLVQKILNVFWFTVFGFFILSMCWVVVGMFGSEVLIIPAVALILLGTSMAHRYGSRPWIMPGENDE